MSVTFASDQSEHCGENESGVIVGRVETKNKIRILFFYNFQNSVVIVRSKERLVLRIALTTVQQVTFHDVFNLLSQLKVTGVACTFLPNHNHVR